jgi:thiamine-monophosphate kinase
VSGELGGASLALDHPRLLAVHTRTELIALGPADEDYPLRRYYLPTPRLALGANLRELATAAIDVSDGVRADLAHIAKQSGVSAWVDATQLPCTSGCLPERALVCGDDYELLFTAPRAKWRDIERAAEAAGQRVTAIGDIRAGSGVTVSGAAASGKAGYQHFD